MRKTQNLRAPILESVAALNRHGMEVVSGIIMGLDTDTAETPQAIIDFVEESQIPLLTVNLLYALPQTPLYDRMQKAGRLVADEHRDSNIAFLEPYEEVVGRWQKVVSTIYEPASLYARFATQARQTYSHRLSVRTLRSQLTLNNLRRFARIFPRLLWQIGVLADYRQYFWRLLWCQVRHRNLEPAFHVAIVAHHLITYSRECLKGTMQSSNYSRRALVRPIETDEPNSIRSAAPETTIGT
jgi:hypothetical protein